MNVSLKNFSFWNWTLKKKIAGTVTFAGVIILVFSIFSFAVTLYFTRAVQMMSFANQIDAAIAEEQIYAWRFLFGDKDAAHRYEYAHSKVADIGGIMTRAGYDGAVLRGVLEKEQSAYEYLARGEFDGSFFDMLARARGGFSLKNNARMAQILGYIKSWAPQGTEISTTAFSVLDGIRYERIILGEADVYADGMQKVAEIKAVNDRVVESVKNLLARDLDFAISRARVSGLAPVLREVKTVVAGMTPSVFPGVSLASASVLRMKEAPRREGIDASVATENFFLRVEELIREHERIEGMLIWNRFDEASATSQSTPILTLGKILSLEQDLRVGAEHILAWQGAYFTKVDPILVSAREDLGRFKEETASIVNVFSIVIQISLILFFVGTLVILVVLGYSVYRVILIPVAHIRDAVQDIGKGNLKRRVRVLGNDEIGHLAAAYNMMAEKLGVAREEMEREVHARTEDLERLKSGLEAEVSRRTAEFEERVRELTRMNTVMVERELKMAEMKAELEKMKKRSRDLS